MFKIETDFQYWWPVRVRMPSQAKPGTFDTAKLDVKFRALDEDAVRKMVADLNNLPEEQRAGHEHDVIISACLDWRDVVDDAGEPIPFSEENLRASMRSAQFRNGLYEAYRWSTTGPAAS